MKPVIFYLFLFAGFTAFSQQPIACCMPSATESFAMLAGNLEFAGGHQEPLPFEFQTQNGHDINYKTSDSVDAHAWEIKSKSPTNNYILVLHEWWGLNDYIKQESENLWNVLGPVNVIALDLYDNKVAVTREDAVKYVQGVKTERAIAIIRGAMTYAGPNARFYTIGWCFGGGWSLQASILAGSQAGGCVMYYGMPEKDPLMLKGLHADVLGIFANRDKGITPALVDEFAENMKNAGKLLEVRRYDAEHGFANPSAPNFDKNAKEDAYKYEISFLQQRIK